MKMVEEQEETSENVLRSRFSETIVPVMFKNRSGRRVKIIWRNYRGEEVPYATVETFSSTNSDDGQETPGCSHFVMNTFVTHPWIAVDESSNERMLLNFQEVYMPSPPQVRRIDYRRRKFLVERTDVIITAPVYTLEEYCKRTIQKLVSKDNISKLPLPVVLLNDMVKTFQVT